MPSRVRSLPIAVSVTEAAHLLGCSRQHCYDLMERGVLRRMRVAGSSIIRVPVVDIYAALGLDPAEIRQ